MKIVGFDEECDTSSLLSRLYFIVWEEEAKINKATARLNSNNAGAEWSRRRIHEEATMISQQEGAEWAKTL